MKSPATFSILVSLLLVTTHLQAEPSIPALHSIAIKQSAIVFEVTSYGCSRDEDFELRVDDSPGITLIRTRPDRCKRAPMVISIKRSLKFLREKHGLSLQQPFAIKNPFTPPPVKRKPLSKGYPEKKRAVQK